MEDWNCNACNGPVRVMGTLGSKLHGRCENCGLDDSREAPDDEDDEDCEDDYDYDDPMDGDHESALASAGMGVDEDYGYYGGDDW